MADMDRAYVNSNYSKCALVSIKQEKAVWIVFSNTVAVCLFSILLVEENHHNIFNSREIKR